MTVFDLFSELNSAYAPEDIDRIINELTLISKKDIKIVVQQAIEKIHNYEFDGSKWSSLALTLIYNYPRKNEPGEILQALLDTDKDNGAYLNNYGVFLEIRQKTGLAIEYYARAYATDYKALGHEKATNLPAWTNLHRLTSHYWRG